MQHRVRECSAHLSATFVFLGFLLVGMPAWADAPDLWLFEEPAASEAELNLPATGSEVQTRGVGAACPAGFHDLGATCGKPRGYGRGAGYPWKFGDAPFDWTKHSGSSGMMKRCQKDNQQGCEIVGALAYPKCREGFVSFGSNLCAPKCPEGMKDFGLLCQKPAGETSVSTRGLEAAAPMAPEAACGTYQIRANADGLLLQLNGQGDQVLGTTGQTNDDAARFIVELQWDGSVRIKHKATGRYLYEDLNDRAISTREAVNDPRTLFRLKPEGAGGMQVISAASGLPWQYNSSGDKHVMGAPQAAVTPAAVRLERVVGPAADPTCTTDVLGAVYERESQQALLERHAAIAALDHTLQGAQAQAGTAGSAGWGELQQATSAYLKRFPQGARELNPREVALIEQQAALLEKQTAIAASAGAMQSDRAQAWGALGSSVAASTTGAAASQVGVQQAVEQTLQAQQRLSQSTQAQFQNQVQTLMAMGGQQGRRPVLAITKARAPRGAWVQSRAIPPADAPTIGTDLVPVPTEEVQQTIEAGDILTLLIPQVDETVQVRTMTVEKPEEAQALLDSLQVQSRAVTSGSGSVIVVQQVETSPTLFEYSQSVNTPQNTISAESRCTTPTQQGQGSKAASVYSMTPEQCREPASYDRGPGTPLVCASGYEQELANCYKPCDPGYHRVAATCWQSCPGGWRDDGLFCAKPGNYARKKYPWKFGDKAFSLDGAKKRCQKDYPAEGCEKQGEIYYNNCKSGYSKLLLDWCTPACPSNFGKDIGVSCTKKNYAAQGGLVTDIGTIPGLPKYGTCKDGRELQGLLCYKPCKSGYKGALNRCNLINK